MSYVALANITLGTTAPTITFSNIPATFRDLVVVFQTTKSTNLTVRMVFNGDTSLAYQFVTLDSTTTDQTTQGTFSSGVRIGDGIQSLNSLINIMDYSVTDKHKTGILQGRADGVFRSQVFRWPSTSAINSILFTAVNSTFDAGTSVALYGIGA